MVVTQREGIFDRGQAVPPMNPDGFKTTREWASAVYATYFMRGIPRNKPFFIVRRQLCYDDHSIPTQFLRTGHFVGVRSDKKRVFQPVEQSGHVGFEIAAARYVEFPAADNGPIRAQEGPLFFDYPTFDYTPVKEPFPSPHTGKPINAFSVAVGISAMDQLCLAECESTPDLDAWYFPAMYALGLETSWHMMAKRKKRIEEITEHLIELSRRTPLKDNIFAIRVALDKARGFGADRWEYPIVRHGVRGERPSEVFADVRALVFTL